MEDNEIPENWKLENEYAQRLIEELNNISDHDLELINQASAEIAKIATRFDCIIVSGGSASLAQKLLIKHGLDPEKIISFPPSDNNRLYKKTTAQSQIRTADQNFAIGVSQVLASLIEHAGLKRREIPTKSYLIVDDHSNTGTKAAFYLKYFLALKNEKIGDEVKYATFSSQSGQIIQPDRIRTETGVMPDDFQPGELERLAKLTILPRSLNKVDQTRVYGSLVAISDGVSYLNDGLVTKNSNFSEPLAQELKRTSADLLTRLYN